jgi:hypothetical protein
MRKRSNSTEKQRAGGQFVARPRHIFDACRGGDSGRKIDEKIGDFYPPAPLKNVAKSTY